MDSDQKAVFQPNPIEDQQSKGQLDKSAAHFPSQGQVIQTIAYRNETQMQPYWELKDGRPTFNEKVRLSVPS